MHSASSPKADLIDRYSATRVLYPASAIFCLALSSAVFWHSTHQGVYLGLFLLAGLSLPAVTGVVRVAVPALYPERLHLRMYSAIAVTFEVAGMRLRTARSGRLLPAAYSGYAFLVIAGLVAASTVCVAGLPRPTRPAAQLLDIVPGITPRALRQHA